MTRHITTHPVQSRAVACDQVLYYGQTAYVLTGGQARGLGQHHAGIGRDRTVVGRGHRTDGTIPAGSAGVELFGRHQHRTCLGPFRRTDHTPPLHEVHEPPGTGEADPELALEHRGGAEL